MQLTVETPEVIGTRLPAPVVKEMLVMTHLKTTRTPIGPPLRSPTLTGGSPGANARKAVNHTKAVPR
jgi:hypothetical protein